MRSAQLANKNRELRRNPMTKPRPTRRPGKSSPAASRFVIQGPPQRSSTKRMAIETENPSRSQPSQLTCKGSQSSIPSEPAPRLRPWMSPPGATPTATKITYHATTRSNPSLPNYRGRVKLSRLNRPRVAEFYPRPQVAGFKVTTEAIYGSRLYCSCQCSERFICSGM